MEFLAITERSSKKSGRFPEGEELRLWLSATKDTKKLKKETGIPAAGTKKAAAAQKPTTDIPEPKLPRKKSAEIDRRTLDKLRKGGFPVDRRLDLHGMTQAVALENLRKTLLSAYAADERLVLVITGKGTKPAEPPTSWLSPETGVLRRKLPEWLSCEPLDRLVLSHCPAKRQHGGEGAFYVLLRRNRR